MFEKSNIPWASLFLWPVVLPSKLKIEEFLLQPHDLPRLTSRVAQLDLRIPMNIWYK